MENFSESRGLRRRILIVDDEIINRLMLENMLSDRYEISMAENGKEALEFLTNGEHVYSLILLDLMMPVMTGFEVLEKVRADERLKAIPVIVMTSEETAEIRSIQQGAADFITKPFKPEVALARCDRIIELFEERSIIRSAEKDSLSGLYTRDFFYEYVRQRLKFSAATSSDMLALNVEHFHLINEMYGRGEGDAVLRRIGEILRERMGETEGLGCRSSGDSFFYFCRHQESYEDLLVAIREGLADFSHLARIRIRVGVYSDVDKSVSPEIWVDRAKMACDGIRGDYTRMLAYYDSSISEKAIFHERLVNDFEESIEKKHFTVFYQPKYHILGDRPVLCSCEALIRWKHPEFGMISPGEFVPLFESNGLIQKLDRFVWSEAARQVREWKTTLGYSVPVSVNVSRIDIYTVDLEVNFQKLLQENGLSPEELKLEITESAYSDNAGRLFEAVENLRGMGFEIEMDDFGSGYSSLNMLTQVPVDVIKMDMKFVRNMLKDANSLRLVELIMDIAKFINVPVVAEGVEEITQLEKLREMGCQIVQGYYFSKPVPPQEFGKFIQREIEAK